MSIQAGIYFIRATSYANICCQIKPTGNYLLTWNGVTTITTPSPTPIITPTQEPTVTPEPTPTETQTIEPTPIKTKADEYIYYGKIYKHKSYIRVNIKPDNSIDKYKNSQTLS